MVLSDAEALSKLEVTVAMPIVVDRRHRELNCAARSCYALRDAASGVAARDLQEVGDVYFLRALALTAEFEAAL